ncbi:WXG100 family type VII secretion target [Nocardia amikacinitolerans]|uniref:WXG100 family type VII secretion target n=1 Tax=Nocardia amikacinitolerans TaxID=756689 RepID=UPI00117C209B|nr:WXG100 family type VII secretion target [Nocardia amikacinitolerans]
MSDELSVSPDRLRAEADTLRGIHNSLVAAAGDIDRAHEDLHASWRGQAASSLMSIWRTEYEALTPFLGRLDELADKLTLAADTFQRQDESRGSEIEQATDAMPES